jgi:hypothetical protein
VSDYGPVAVDLLTHSLRFSGISEDPDQFRRLSDVLNAPAGEFVISRVTVKNLMGVTLETCATAVVQKRDVFMVVPRESADQLAQRRAGRFGVTPPEMIRMPVVVVTPPYVARGFVNLASPRDFYRGASAFNPFFPLLDATLRLEGVLVERTPVLLVNRDAIVALAVEDEAVLKVRPALATLGEPPPTLAELAARAQTSLAPADAAAPAQPAMPVFRSGDSLAALVAKMNQLAQPESESEKPPDTDKAAPTDGGSDPRPAPDLGLRPQRFQPAV